MENIFWKIELQIPHPKSSYWRNMVVINLDSGEEKEWKEKANLALQIQSYIDQAYWGESNEWENERLKLANNFIKHLWAEFPELKISEELKRFKEWK